MPKTRKIQQASKSRPTLEGAGVHLKRAFGFGDTKLFDPFLLLDDFRGDDPQQYIKGFPWHPHRGIETITYMLRGEVEHGDSLGNKGVISSGDVQWMTAGSGILHQEMPKGDPDGRMYGFQLWANLPSTNKMMPPRYRDVKVNQIPLVLLGGGVQVRLICGQVGERRGPVQDVVIEPEYLDVSVPAGVTFTHPTQPGHTVFAYVIEGEGVFSDDSTDGSGLQSNTTLVVFGDGEQVQITAGEAGLRFLLVSGQPIREPVAWYGPIVMNTSAELQTAYEELRNGTFIR